MWRVGRFPIACGPRCRSHQRLLERLRPKELCVQAHNLTMFKKTLLPVRGIVLRSWGVCCGHDWLVSRERFSRSPAIHSCGERKIGEGQIMEGSVVGAGTMRRLPSVHRGHAAGRGMLGQLPGDGNSKVQRREFQESARSLDDNGLWDVQSGLSSGIRGHGWQFASSSLEHLGDRCIGPVICREPGRSACPLRTWVQQTETTLARCARKQEQRRGAT